MKRAERFKKFITTEEIRTIPLLPFDDKDEKTDNDDDFFDLDYKEDFILLKDIDLEYKREFDKLKELQDTVGYHAKIVESYGYDRHTGDYDLKKFPITKEDKQKDMIAKDFKNYFHALEEYNEYLKELIKKYDIKPTGNLVQRLIFMVHNDVDNANAKNQQDFDLKYIMVAVDWKDFFPDS